MSNDIRGKIRKITMGPDPLNGLAFAVDQTKGVPGKIVEIKDDKNYLMQTGREKILVIVENYENVVYVWKEIFNVPFVLEFGNPKEFPVNHV